MSCAPRSVRLQCLLSTYGCGRAGLSSRRAQVNLDLAWAQAQRKRDAEATLNLLDAENAAPEAVAHNVMAREVMREMLARSKRGHGSSLQALATRAGVLH